MSRKDKRMDAIGLIETSSIARGYEIQDAMLKAADVTLMVARTICSGKYMIVVAGEVSAVEAATHAGSDKARGVLIEDLIILICIPMFSRQLAAQLIWKKRI